MSVSSDLILYRASAGSGKTYTLAKEYLKIVIRNPYDYNKILAVTFTRKATEEMKTRIIEYLALLEKNDHKVTSLKDAIIREIREDKNIDITEEFDNNVSTALQLILHDYSNFNISTIDSFFQGIIRSFAKELDLPIGMEVELDTDAVIQQAVQAMLKEYKTDKDAFSKWIEEYLFDLIEEDKSWKIEKHISKLAKQILREEYQLLALQNNQEFDIESYKNVLGELKRMVVDYRKKLNELTEEVHRKIAADSLDLSLYFQGTKSIQSFINKTKEYAPEANSYLQKMLSGGDLYSKTKLKDGSDTALLDAAWNNYLIYYINDVLSHKEMHQQRYNSADIVLKNIYSLALLEFINLKIKEYKANENLILISDTNQIISLIAQHEDVPFIFEKSANFLKYILVDEFQDTSSLQWKGMLPLLLEILQNINGIVLIVGDPKQSIYRWRGGRMELIMDGIEPDMSYHWKGRKGISLQENYRSAKEIVEFNNAFFSTVKNEITLQDPFFQKVLEDVEQNIVRTEHKGFVQCKWLEKNKDKEEDDVQLQEVLQTIQSVHLSKPYSDIAVLTRNNMHGAAVANYLQEHHIPVVSAESLLLQSSVSVKLLIAALEYIVHPQEDFYCVKLNYQYAQYLQQENIGSFLLKKKEEPYFFEERLPGISRKKVQELSSVAINELIFTLMHEMDLDVQIDNYLLRLQDIVLQYSQQHSNSIREFLDFWNEQKHKLCIIPPDGIDAVKIYTIHKSKGLQFPVVIVPYANWKMTPKFDSTIWLKSSEKPFDQLQAFPVEMVKKMEDSLFAEVYTKELESTYIDNINLLYVAFTRAEEQLYIFSTAEKDKPEPLPQNVSRLLSHILNKIALPGAAIENNEFLFGSKDSISKGNEKYTAHKVIEPVAFHNFKKQISLVSKEEYNIAQVKGNMMHTVLSKVYQPEYLQKALRTSIPDKDERSVYQAAAEKIVEEFAKRNWFDAEWKQINERAIWSGSKELRPDKILLSDEECIIIDYKTGAKKKEHIEKMTEYVEAYSASAFSREKISAYLIYVGEIITLDKVVG